MSVPSQMSLRRIPTCLHLTIRVAYASAWEALVRTHTDQAVQFIQEFAPRIPPLEALELYFRVVAVPDPMQELVRTRTLTSLEIDTLAPLATIPALRGWQRLRLDLVLEHRRYRRRHQESTLQLARMVPHRPDHPSMPALRRGNDWARAFGGPMALVWGTRDPVLGRALRRHERDFPQAPVTRTRAGHFLQEEVPQDLADAVEDVARRLARG